MNNYYYRQLDEEVDSDSSDSKSGKNDGEYSFEGFSIEVNAKIELTPAGANN